jgi:hypothetical protein
LDLFKRVIVTRQMFAVGIPLLKAHRGNSLIARLSGVSRGRVTLGADLICLRLAAHSKDFKDKLPVLSRKHRDSKLLKALAQ